MAAWQGTRLMVAYAALEATGSPAFVGLVAAIFALAGFLVSIPSGRMIDRYGSTRVTVVATLVCITGIVIAAALQSIVGLIVVAVLVGAGHVYIIVAQQGFVARAANGNLDSAFGAQTAAVSMGQLFGPPLVTLAASSAGLDNTHPNSWVGMLVCAGFLVLSLPTYFALRPVERLIPPALARSERAAKLTDVLRLPGMTRSLLVGAGVLVTVDLLAAFIPVWAVSQDIPAVIVGWLLALRALFTIISRFGVGRLVARFGRKVLLIGAISLAALAIALLPFADAWWAIPIMIMIGLGLGLPQPLTLAWMSSLAPARAHGAVLGARMTVNRLAQVVFPLLVASTAGSVGVFAVFWSTAAIMAGSAILVAVTKASALNEHATPRDVDRDASSPDPTT
ncbi:MAG: MFS transporter [Actinomycetota bacterium]|nr:MFS transporter [Actinomycetota bacterium]